MFKTKTKFNLQIVDFSVIKVGYPELQLNGELPRCEIIFKNKEFMVRNINDLKHQNTKSPEVKN